MTRTLKLQRDKSGCHTCNLRHALVGLGFASNETAAQRMIAVGMVYIDGRPVDRSVMVGAGVLVGVRGRGPRVVCKGRV